MLYPHTISEVVNIIIIHRLCYRAHVQTSTLVFVPGTQAVPYLLLYSNSTRQGTGWPERILIIGLAVGEIWHQQVSSSVRVMAWLCETDTSKGI